MGNKRTYRSVPEARFVKRALETASGKNIDDAIANIGKIIKPGDKFTSEDLEKLQNNNTGLYFETEKTGSFLPCEIIFDEDVGFDTATLIVHCNVNCSEFYTKVFKSGKFTLTYIIDTTAADTSIIPNVYAPAGDGSLNIGLGDVVIEKWSLKVNELLSYGDDTKEVLHDYEKQLLSNATSLRYIYNEQTDDEVFYVNINPDSTSDDPIWLVCINRFEIKIMSVDKGDSLYNQHLNPTVYNLENFLSSSNVKTFFGNKSIIKDPTKPEDNNIDLYKHHLTLVANGNVFMGVIISSNNLDCTGVGTKLITLLKCTPGEDKYCEHFLKLQGNGSGQEYILYYNGSILQMINGTADPVNITNVEDKVETV